MAWSLPSRKSTAPRLCKFTSPTARKLKANDVVLALGNPPPAPLPGSDSLRGSARYVADPWQAPPSFRAGETVLIAGTGLTMADTVIAGCTGHRRKVAIHAISRHGLLPTPQTSFHSVKDERSTLLFMRSASASLLRLFREVRTLSEEIESRGGDWGRPRHQLHGSRLRRATHPAAPVSGAGRHSLEHAGYDIDRYEGLIGVFAGASKNTYGWNGGAESPDIQAEIDSGLGSIANRVSYKLNLRGPSLAVHTACSTSLVAVHLACQSLLNFECDIALAGGASISLPQVGYIYQKNGILSPDGHCRAYDANARGTVPGNGLGIVVLKRLADAIADRDKIFAVVRGSAINNDGSQKVGYTAPSVEAQIAVMSAALAIADVRPRTIGLVEGHGTGTVVGDAIELTALTEVFSADPGNPRSCALGSIKANIGHLDVAAGVSGVIKATLCLMLHRPACG
jgi:hypothetical protein